MAGRVNGPKSGEAHGRNPPKKQDEIVLNMFRNGEILEKHRVEVELT